jgi:hypothetical protein
VEIRYDVIEEAKRKRMGQLNALEVRFGIRTPICPSGGGS